MLHAILITQLWLTSSLTADIDGIDMDGAYWGMSVEQLNEMVTVQPASSVGQYSFADHMEVNPDVYLRKKNNGNRIEYYFYNGKLYKIFVVYSRQNSNLNQYKKRVAELIKQNGPPQNNYEEVYFGIAVQHTLWEDKDNVFDLRYGAGFVYEVKVNKSLAKSKSLELLKKHSI